MKEKVNSLQSETIEKDSAALFNRYMHIISSKDSEQTYRLKSDTGEGIMRRYNVAKGVYCIYSEIESYYPERQALKQLIKYIEIMYMIEGHAEFEMENRFCASADTGDVCIFNSRVAAKNCIVGEKGMRCLSIIVCIDDAADELNRIFDTKAFNKEVMFSGALDADCCICFPATNMLKEIFGEMLKIPEKYGAFYRKLLAFQVIMATMDIKGQKVSDRQYFSKDT